jgi:hypothetical protein
MKTRLHEIIFEAETPAGKAFDIGLILTILLSVLVVMLESVAGIRRQYGPVLQAMEWGFTIAFTIEYFLRLYCVGKPLHYVGSFYGVVDLLAIIPTYLSVFLLGTQYLLVIRTVRILPARNAAPKAMMPMRFTANIVGQSCKLKKKACLVSGTGADGWYPVRSSMPGARGQRSMTNRYRFIDYQRAAGAAQKEISLHRLYPEPEKDETGRIVCIQPVVTKIAAHEVLKLYQFYVSVRFMEQFKAVVPLAAYLVLFQLIILRQVVEDSWIITGGLLAVILGLMFFMEGLKLGMMPFGTVIGATLPRQSPLPVVLIITLLLGVGVTFAEPAISALKTAGQNVVVEHAPYLYALLNDWSEALVLVVGASVGLAAVIGTLRFLYGWSLKPLVYASLVPVLGLSVYAASDPELSKALGLAWDTGAVTTGPVTVPLVLSLGIGIAAAAGKGDSALSGFGIVTLASLFPIGGVLMLLLYVASTVTPAAIIAAAAGHAAAQAAGPAWYEQSPGQELILGIRAILPLVLFLFLVLKVMLKEQLQHRSEIFLGIGLTMIGMCIFNLGLTYGLAKLGGSVGGLVPMAFMEVDGVTGSPIYRYAVGLSLALLFAWVLGFGATIAEPALNALGITAEQLTNGVFKKRTLIMAVSAGVAFGIAIGLVKLIFDLPLIWLILPGYLVAVVLTFFSTEEFVNVAWDSAGVTTGPITVPLVLAMGLGFGNATKAVEGFGILSIASIGPVITVMISGLWSRYRVNTEIRAVAKGALAPKAEIAEVIV